MPALTTQGTLTHTRMRKAGLAGPDAGPSADDRGGRCAVVRRAERRRAHERMLGRKEPRDRMDARDLERRCVVERREDAGQAASEHGLARAGGPCEEEVL